MKKGLNFKKQAQFCEMNLRCTGQKGKKIPKIHFNVESNDNHLKNCCPHDKNLSSPLGAKKSKNNQKAAQSYQKNHSIDHKFKKGLRNHLQSKTQRYQSIQGQDNSKTTLRKGHFTDRKDKEFTSPKRMKKKFKNSKSISPKQNLKKDDSQTNKSPKKLSKSRSSNQIKKKKNTRVIYQNNFFLIGDNFVEVNENLLRKFSQNLAHSHFQEKSQNISQVQSIIFKSQQIPSTKSTKMQIVPSLNEHSMEEISNLGEHSVIKRISDFSEEEEQDKQSLNRMQHLIQSPIKNNSPTPQEVGEDTLEMRVNAANLQMKTRKQILERLFTSNKIDKQVYMNNLDLIMESYDRQLNQIQTIKNLMDSNARRVEEIVSKTKQDIITAEKIHEKSAEQILEQIFGFQRDKDKITNTQYDEFYDDLNPHKKFYNNNFSQLLTNYRQNQQVKNQIEERISIQMGITADKKEKGIKTSVASIYLFLKNFFAFFIEKYQNEFLKYINMPYGYSPEQRLIYMQGYDEDIHSHSNRKIVYGLEEVIRSQILSEFHEKFYSDKKKIGIEYEKVHNHLIFDCFNEGLNYYRPYYFINGPPYMWTTCEKALTFYYIAEENVQEVFQKTQIKVLKWATSLCGLMISEQSEMQEKRQILTLEEIIEEYNRTNHPILLEHRQNKILKKQKVQIEENSFEWNFFDEQRTAVMYEISSLLLEQASEEIAAFLISKEMERILSFY